jgi:hypothetical protein
MAEWEDGMKIKFEDGNLTISRKVKIKNITSITVEQKIGGKFSIPYHGYNGKHFTAYTLTAHKVSFHGFEFSKGPRKWKHLFFRHWKDSVTGKYINYYTLLADKGGSCP